MCGVPYHAAQWYIRRLINAGRRVAVCDQTSEPQPGRKIVDREVTQIISAGTVSELSWLDAKRANYLGAIYADSDAFGFAYADLSTGEFRLTQAHDRKSLHDQIARWLRVRADARGSRCRRGNRALFKAPTPAQNRPPHFVALRCADGSRP